MKSEYSFLLAPGENLYIRVYISHRNFYFHSSFIFDIGRLPRALIAVDVLAEGEQLQFAEQSPVTHVLSGTCFPFNYMYFDTSRCVALETYSRQRLAMSIDATACSVVVSLHRTGIDIPQQRNRCDASRTEIAISLSKTCTYTHTHTRTGTNRQSADCVSHAN